jgi:FkbM family methyltransferase
MDLNLRKKTFKSLEKNIKLSKIPKEKINIYNLALGEKKETLNFEYLKFQDMSSRILKNKNKKNRDESIIEKVKVEPLDQLKINLNPKKIRLILIDVEGFEFEVLKGMKKLLCNLEEVDIIIEIHQESKNKEKIFKLFKEKKFKIEQIDHANYIFSKRKNK